MKGNSYNIILLLDMMELKKKKKKKRPSFDSCRRINIKKDGRFSVILLNFIIKIILVVI